MFLSNKVRRGEERKKMTLIKYFPQMSVSQENEINSFLSKYPPLDERELIEIVRKKLPTANIVRTFCSTISSEWMRLAKTRLLCWDITVHLKQQGFVGANVDKYLIGLLLNYLYQRKASKQDIRDLVNGIDNYLKGDDRTFSKFVEMIQKSKLAKSVDIPYESLLKKAMSDVKEIEEIYARLERLKEYDNRAMENI